MSTTDWSLSSLDEFEEPDPSKVAIETTLKEHRYELSVVGSETCICTCGYYPPRHAPESLTELFETHLADALWQRRPHTCEPGEVIWKFDGGRGALLCSNCRTIVGYMKTPPQTKN